MNIPTFSDVLLARRQISPYLRRTPLYSYPALNAFIGTEVHIKHENYQPVGAFKVRGGINLISQLSPDERVRGVIAVSTGNHGQSVAYAARLFGVKARIVVPEGANPGKVAAMQAMGAEVISMVRSMMTRNCTAKHWCANMATVISIRATSPCLSRESRLRH